MLVWNKEDAAVAAAHSVDPDRWWTGFGHLLDRIGGRFTRHEPRRHAASLMLGLLSDLDRKNCWSIAEHRGAKTPDALQHLLSRSVWDADLIRDDLRGYVIDNLGDPSAVLVVDETGDLKKGSHSVGVQRQYTGTAGRIENSQVAVYLAYASPTGHALIDRALYLPQSWTDVPGRCTAAGIPKGTGFATKPALATAMITAALNAGTPASWVAGDEVYGADPTLRKTLEDRGVGYVLAIASNRRVTTGNGTWQVDTLAAALPLSASFLRTGQPAVLPQHVEQALHRVGVHAHSRAIQRERRESRLLVRHRPPWPLLGASSVHRRADLAVGNGGAAMIRSGVAGTSRTSNPPCLKALTTAAAGPSIGISPTPFAPNGPCGYGFSNITTSSGGVSSDVGMM